MSDVDQKKVAQDTFWWWINERHQIYLRRQDGEKWPWTEDWVLRDWRFCNVFRELDSTTEWLRKAWREPYASDKNLWFAMAMARFINHVPTLAEVGYPEGEFMPEILTKKLQARKARKEKVFTSAYMITGKLGGDNGEDKATMVSERVLFPLYTYFDPDTCIDPSSLERSWEILKNFNGYGGSGFMAYEVITDLRHTRYLRNAKDIYTWANPGPGAIRGLTRMMTGTTKRSSTMPKQAAIALMQNLLKTANGPDSPLGDHIPRPLEMRDIEHCLCETDKYLRTLNGEGSPRERYRQPVPKGIFE